MTEFDKQTILKAAEKYREAPYFRFAIDFCIGFIAANAIIFIVRYFL